MTKIGEGLTFKPKDVTKKLLAVLAPRAREVVAKRYGLEEGSKRQTLESIGQKYGITRERVRQIENAALAAIKKSSEFKAFDPIFDELKQVLYAHGGIVHEDEFLGAITKDSAKGGSASGGKSTENHIHFMLVIGEAFTKLKEDEEFHHRWTVDARLADRVHNSIRNLCQNFSEKDLVSEPDLISSFLLELKDVTKDPEVKEFAKSWISLSKRIGKNPLGEWGLAQSPNVHMRGIRDYAFLVLRKHGSPMHFTEVAKEITKMFGKQAHPATCHNELIKDKRFVLVGRGLYALTEWGYSRGIVSEVIKNILKKDGPLAKEEVITRVKKERYVKDNTIMVNLQNSKLFKKAKDGRYSLA
ncbi:MAG: hypothetical protein A2114_01730 [Candidatus Vogelbacteria bacterium GWA1_51_14]|uniref:HTH HARE-type domain-containing protein n=1 Tax=Candidatus Vogelbacteria bacterium GWA1_51_14 TaxID=1802435 RepID=A0A1G2Q8L3_9BACT|nr:MAG: hypothetical protein A2114_01730 [Candidatus Vogelbacteria bacterium GWA1_51_14]